MSGDRPSRLFDVVAETLRRWSRAEKQPIALPAPVAVELPTAARRQSERGKMPSREPAHADTSRIEIELANGRRVRVGACVDATALKKIIDLLEA